MADAVSEMIEKWDLPLQQIIALCYDTTASNSGKLKGSVKLVEAIVKHACLWLACRHHVGELHIKHVNIRIRGDTSGIVFTNLSTKSFDWGHRRLELFQH